MLVAIHLTERAKGYLKRVEKLATRDNISLEELLEQVFNQYARLFPSPETDAPPRGTPGHKLVEAVRNVDLKGGGPDTSSRTRQILEDEYDDYLQNRLSTDAE